MDLPSRRLSVRRALGRPVEADLILCGGESVPGWVVDEQDDGVGMAFGGPDAEAISGHRDCCVGRAAEVRVGDDETRGRAVPVWVVHVTDGPKGGTCRAGIAFDVPRMRAEDVGHLLAVWRRLHSEA